MAAISYWFLSPSVILALIGKWKGWDRTKPTPTFDWKTATVDVVIPAKDEEASIALCLASLFDQDFRIRTVTVIDDASTDRT
ncbi:MAG TPA: glycosyltransferase, partial [Bryobacteraceae bacterium]|nr:glycosyltransferase [Bryobacteraceae bacterium]